MKFVDLSHPISNTTSTYPSDPDISIVKEKEIEIDHSLLHSFKMGTHTGSHLDVPSHIIPGSKTLDDFPISTFTGTAMKVTEKSFLGLNKIIENIDGILYDTGWYQYYEDPSTYYGPQRPVIPEHLLEIILRLKIKFFGCDMPSVDVSGSKHKPVHHTLLGSDIIVYESLTNFDQLPVLIPFQFYGFPLPFKNLDGSPVRAIGVI